MTPKLQNEIALFCYASVSRMFAMFHNDEFRGPNFKWEEFAEMMEKHCKTNLFVNVKFPKKQKEECEEHAGNTAREIAENLVHWMTEKN